MAIGVWISLPGSPPDEASGMSASPAASAVIRIGASRSIAPRRTASAESVTPSCSTRWWMWETIMMPLRVAMPNSVMKPMSDATHSTPPESKTPATPPISASGRLTMMTAASAARARARTKRTRKMPSDHHEPEEEQRPRGLLRALELAAVLDAVAGGS